MRTLGRVIWYISFYLPASIARCTTSFQDDLNALFVKFIPISITLASVGLVVFALFDIMMFFDGDVKDVCNENTNKDSNLLELFVETVTKNIINIASIFISLLIHVAFTENKSDVLVVHRYSG